MSRATDKATIGSRDNSQGTVAIYADLASRAVPVEIAIPERFVQLASTNPDDMRRRLEV